jgi:hypothetical protein
MLAVGTLRGTAVSLTGYEMGQAPYFDSQLEAIPEMARPVTVGWTGNEYLVVGLSEQGHYTAAYGRHGSWATNPGPGFAAGEMVGLAIAPLIDDYEDQKYSTGVAAVAGIREGLPRYHMVAVGTIKGDAVAIVGHGYGDMPFFNPRTYYIPDMARPTAIRWTGQYYVVVGVGDNGEPVAAHGDGENWVPVGLKNVPSVPGGRVSDFTISPLRDPVSLLPYSRYEILTVAAQKGKVLSTLGQEESNEPFFGRELRDIPDLLCTGLDCDDEAFASRQPMISEAYPNPFNPVASLRFLLPEAARVDVVVFDAMGRRVAHLLSADLPACWHAAQFDGSGLASGSYVAQVNAGVYTSTQRLMLLK